MSELEQVRGELNWANSRITELEKEVNQLRSEFFTLKHILNFPEPEEHVRRLAELKAQLKSKWFRRSFWLHQWISDHTSNIVYLHLSTTGSGKSDQVFEVAVLPFKGAAFLNQRVLPSIPIPQQACEIYGITDGEFSNCPLWSDLEKELRELLEGKQVVMFDAELQLRILQQTATAFHCAAGWIDNLNIHCAKRWFLKLFGSKNNNGSITLKDACHQSVPGKDEFSRYIERGCSSTRGESGQCAEVQAEMTRRIVMLSSEKHYDLPIAYSALKGGQTLEYPDVSDLS